MGALELILATPAENETLNSNHLTSQKAIASCGDDAREVWMRKLRFFEGTFDFCRGNGEINMHNNPTSSNSSSLKNINIIS